MALDTNALVAAVVRSVLEQLGQPLGLQPNPRFEQQPQPVALVLAPASAALAHEIEQRLQGSPNGNMTVCFGDVPAASQGNANAEPALYIIPELSCSDMADLAAGKASSLNLHRVLDLLLAGKAVSTMGFAFRAHAHTAPLALLRLYEGYAQTLASYGLTELPAAAHDAVLRETLVTAEHVTAAVAEGAGVLRVPYHALITPLAEQIAAEHHVSILKNM